METQHTKTYGDEAKALPREIVIAINVNIRKQERLQINNLISTLKELEKKRTKMVA